MIDDSTSTQPTTTIRAYLALAAGILLIGLVPVLTKLAARGTTGVVVGFFRLTIAGLILSIPAAYNRRRRRTALPRGALWWGLLGGLAFAADIGVWNTSLTLTSAANAALLGNIAPLWVGLGAWLILRERLHLSYWLGLVVALAGAALVVGIDALSASQVNPGDLLAVAASFLYATYQLVTQRAREQLDTLTYMWLFTASGAVVLLIFSLLLGHPMLGLPVSSYLAMIVLALFLHVGGWMLIGYAFGHLRASFLSVTLLGQPVVAAIVAIPALKEGLDLPQIVGGLITLIGIYVVHRSFNPKEMES